MMISSNQKDRLDARDSFHELRKREPYRLFDDEADALDREVTRLVSERIKQKNEFLISKDNVSHYSHGNLWTHVDATTGQRNEGAFVQQSAETTTPIQQLIDNDATIVSVFIEEIAEKMHAQVARSIYELIGNTAESIGHVGRLDVSEGMTEDEEYASIINGLDALFEKLELGIDRNGAVSYPELHLHPDNTKMLRALQRKMAEGSDEGAEERLRRKEIEALSREIERLRAFRHE